MAENRLTRRPPEWWSEAKEWLTPAEKDNYFGVVPMVRNGLTATMNAAEVLGGYRSANEEDATKFLLDAWAPSGMAGALARPGLGTFGGRHAMQGPNPEYAREAGWKNPGRADAQWQSDEAASIADYERSLGFDPNEATAYETGGWFLGEDGIPRFEISDIGAKWKNPDEPLKDIDWLGGRLGDVLKHEELFSRYPDLADIALKRMGGFDFNTIGAYDDKLKTMWLQAGREPNEMMSTAMHELQHAIQSREGFARGGNQQMFITDEDKAVLEAKERAWRNLYRYRESGSADRTVLDEELAALTAKHGYNVTASNVESIFSLLNKEKEIGANHSARMFKPVDESKADMLFGYKKVPDAEWGPLYNDIINNDILKDYGARHQAWWDATNKSEPINTRAYNDYRDLAGEREARLVQNRLGLFPEQWGEVPPWNMESVPLQGEGRTSPIVQFGDEGGAAASIEDIRKAPWFDAYHGTTRGEIEGDFHDFSHFGTVEAANERIKNVANLSDTAREFYHAKKGEETPAIYPVKANLGKTFETDDLGDFNDAELFSAMRNAGIISQEEYLAAHLGEGKDAWTMLKDLGYDSLKYQNGWEDKGNDSYVIFDSKNQLRPRFESNQLKKSSTRSESRDYPDVRLADRIDDDRVRQFLEDHGYSMYSGRGNKAETYDFTPEGIRAYTSTVGPDGKVGIEQKTFDVPTLKQLRNWMGY